jgi:hypothetical protein
VDTGLGPLSVSSVASYVRSGSLKVSEGGCFFGAGHAPPGTTELSRMSSAAAITIVA